MVAPPFISEGLALTTTLSGRAAPSREKDAAIAAASERFNFGLDDGGDCDSTDEKP